MRVLKKMMKDWRWFRQILASEKVIKQNPMITASLIKDPRRDTFYKAVAKSSLHRQSKKLRLINKIKRYANRLADITLGNGIR